MLQYVYGMKKVSKTRSVIMMLNKFEGSNEAISVVSLAEELGDEMNRTTVYRILKRLEDNGTLHSFIGKDGVKWYAKSKKDSSGYMCKTHPHFQCKDCGKTECVTVDVEIPQIPEYRIDSVSLLYVGSCGKCNS